MSFSKSAAITGRKNYPRIQGAWNLHRIPHVTQSMEFSTIVREVLKALWWSIPAALAVGFLRSPKSKGVLGEALVTLSAKFRLPRETYFRLHNVTLPTPDGTTQIDHIFVSRFGIFVVETKNMKGWIFGDENHDQWTQKIYKKPFKFQNPIRQNYKHVKALEAALDVPPDTIRSVVAFLGESRFKTAMPANVTRGGGYITHIKSFTVPVLSDVQVKNAVSQLKAARLAPSRKTHDQHVEHLKTRSNPNAERKCQKCGSSLVLRTARRGRNAGSQFWGCSTYPKCKAVQSVT